MDFTPEQEESLKDAMSQAVLDLLGSGYVESYYRQNAADFISIAKWWAKDLLPKVPQPVAGSDLSHITA